MIRDFTLLKLYKFKALKITCITGTVPVCACMLLDVGAANLIVKVRYL